WKKWASRTFTKRWIGSCREIRIKNSGSISKSFCETVTYSAEGAASEGAWGKHLFSGICPSADRFLKERRFTNRRRFRFGGLETAAPCLQQRRSIQMLGDVRRTSANHIHAEPCPSELGSLPGNLLNHSLHAADDK